MTDAPRGVEVDLLVEGVPLPKHRDTSGENRTYVIASPDREYTIQVRSSEIDCLATACVEGHRVLCRSESFLPVWKGKSRSFCGFETERALRPVEHGTDLEQSTTHRPFVFTVPEGREDVEATAMRCVEVQLFAVEKDLVPWRGARAGCVHSRVEEPQRPILASHERKNYYVCGEEPIATRPGDPVTSTRRLGSGYRWVGDRKMRERVKQGPPLGRIVIHYVGRDQANRLRALPSQPRALAAPPWAGAFGAAPAADPSRPRVVVDAPNVARYFAAATSAGRQRPADVDALVLEGEAPDALLVLVFSSPVSWEELFPYAPPLLVGGARRAQLG
ncbi:unnamed protein product [Symbiodinium natans]|uniref:Uncharacterized protein n=1 Tax=Symbiodinium natans TaxID=878477 RepID=A0A812NYE0_9DINO|nr:unnamed protein product [Symbiodinium natans]